MANYAFEDVEVVDLMWGANVYIQHAISVCLRGSILSRLKGFDQYLVGRSITHLNDCSSYGL